MATSQTPINDLPINIEMITKNIDHTKITTESLEDVSQNPGILKMFYNLSLSLYLQKILHII